MECVAPYAGAWIEMPPLPVRSGTLPVAPYAGAWIEILVIKPQREKGKRSLPTRERGLKYVIMYHQHSAICVAPYAGAWIEIGEARRKFIAQKVAPYAGAWIEMQGQSHHTPIADRRSLRGSVD